jgi:hypothetical protein
MKTIDLDQLVCVTGGMGPASPQGMGGPPGAGGVNYNTPMVSGPSGGGFQYNTPMVSSPSGGGFDHNTPNVTSGSDPSWTQGLGSMFSSMGM